jgi:hypothetical protein
MTSTKALIVTVVALLCETLARSQSTQIYCPVALHVQEAPDLAKLEAWHAYDSSYKGMHPFYDIAFSEGPPEKLVYRNPTHSTKTKLKRMDAYEFAQVSEDMWISCLYRDTSQTLTRKLEKKFSRCEVSYDPKTAFRTVKGIECF